MGIQTAIVLIIVLAAIVYLIRRFAKNRRAPRGCPGCDACHRDSNCDH